MLVRDRIGRWAAIVLFAALFVGTAGGTALAGGPTSVLLVAPGKEQSAALYYSDPDYQTLTDAVGMQPEGVPTAATGSQGTGDYITVTWLIHDVLIWRIDRIYLGGSGRPWVATVLIDGSVPGAEPPPPGSSGDAKAIWHRPTNASALMSLLADLGLVGSATPVEAGPSSLSTPPVASAAVAPAQRTSAATSSLDRTVPGWAWGVGGALLGAIAAVAALRVGRDRRVPGVADGSSAGETYIDLDRASSPSR